MRSLGRNIVLAVVLGVVVYAVLAVYADVGQLGVELGRYAWWTFAAALGLAFSNYLIRFVKWELYRRQLAIALGLGESFGVFLAGFVMSVTPAKLGEVLKSFLLKERRGVPIATSAPIVLAERLTDLIALIVLAAVGALSFRQGALVLAGGALLVGLIAVVVGVRSVSEWTARRLGRLPLLRRRAESVAELFRSAYRLCRAPNLPLPVLLSAAGWCCEAVAMWLIVNGFPGVSADFGTVLFIYSLSTVAGALAMMPGGLGVTDGGMAGMLVLLLATVRPGVASAATILVRLATLWFAVVVGLAALAALRASPPRPYGQADSSTEIDNR
ncbi:MAG: flippase-like domain-containing protein [Deltaproteobacteria bacterium]|nr:flippase-like domain-containing protein [Deltaproteobacteria bacterium]